jgi:hypothetical protein
MLDDTHPVVEASLTKHERRRVAAGVIIDRPLATLEPTQWDVAGVR